MRTTYHLFKVNNELMTLSIEEACKIGTPEIKEQLKRIKENQANKRRVKDGFTPGWQENINKNCGSQAEYNRTLKEMGLVEIGRDYIPKDSTTTCNPFGSDEMVKAIIDTGIELSGQEADGVKSGELFKDIPVSLTED